MKYFCDKYGKECPNTTPQAQSYICDAWDPREFLADKTCRHALTVDNMEMAKQQWLAAQKIGPKKKRMIETPERPAPQPVIINKAGEIDAKQTAILQRLELEKRQTAALEKIAAIMENVAPMIHRALAAIIDFCGDDEEVDDE